MKNILIIDVDSERKPNLIIGKPNTIPKPSNREEAQKTILDDIFLLCEALCQHIDTAGHHGYGDKQKLVNDTIFHIMKTTNDETKKENNGETNDKIQ